MSTTKATKNRWIKPVLLTALVLLLAGSGVVYYFFTLKFDDTATIKADFSVNALDLIGEFAQNDSLANSKYTEKILEVRGRVTEAEAADSTINLKFIDTTTGNYAIFAFQAQDIAAAKTVKPGDSVAIKGSCSGGTFSKLLEITYISFKRCAIIK